MRLVSSVSVVTRLRAWTMKESDFVALQKQRLQYTKSRTTVGTLQPFTEQEPEFF